MEFFNERFVRVKFVVVIEIEMACCYMPYYTGGEENG
jgi:hypothetical protein